MTSYCVNLTARPGPGAQAIDDYIYLSDFSNNSSPVAFYCHVRIRGMTFELTDKFWAKSLEVILNITLPYIYSSL